MDKMIKRDPKSRKGKAAFTNVGNVLSGIISKLGLDSRLRQKAALNLWPIVVGETFAAKTRPLFIDNENNLVVAVQDASVAQELSFHKREITNKLKRAATMTGVTISAVRFSLKHYSQAVEDNEGSGALINEAIVSGSIHSLDKFAGMKPNEEELAQIALTLEEENEIADLKVSLGNSFEAIGELEAAKVNTLAGRIARLVENDLRISKWRDKMGFPSCKSCGERASRLHTDNELCSFCYQRENKS